VSLQRRPPGRRLFFGTAPTRRGRAPERGGEPTLPGLEAGRGRAVFNLRASRRCRRPRARFDAFGRARDAEPLAGSGPGPPRPADVGRMPHWSFGQGRVGKPRKPHQGNAREISRSRGSPVNERRLKRWQHGFRVDAIRERSSCGRNGGRCGREGGHARAVRVGDTVGRCGRSGLRPRRARVRAEAGAATPSPRGPRRSGGRVQRPRLDGTARRARCSPQRRARSGDDGCSRPARPAGRALARGRYARAGHRRLGPSPGKRRQRGGRATVAAAPERARAAWRPASDGRTRPQPAPRPHRLIPTA